jgi:predicted amidophosphoribosyltransferase
MAARRRMQRGYDHAELLARAACRQTGPRSAPFDPSALKRVRNTPPQRGLDGARRRANLVGAFAARSDRVYDRRVLVIDDVTTTGTTMRACFAALRAAGACAVGGLALLRTLDDAAEALSERAERFTPGTE